MIATGLTFLLGFFAAMLLALLVAPVIWRRAKRLARREFEATIPSSVNEIRASFDHVRAEAALQSRQREMDALAMRDKAALERADAGRVARENAELRAHSRGLAETVAQQESDLKELAAALASREEEYGRLESQLRETQLDLERSTDEMDDLAARFRELTQIAEERKIDTLTLDSKLERVSDDLRSAERREGEKASAIERLRGELNTLEGHLQREKVASRKLEEKVVRLTARLADQEEQVSAHGPRPTGLLPDENMIEQDVPDVPMDGREPSMTDEPETRKAALPPSKPTIGQSVRDALDLPEHPLGEEHLEEADLRQRISDIAARVVHLTAKAEGTGSPIDTILEEAEKAPSSSSDPETKQVTLADRVRRLRDKETAGGRATG
ncbi:hypothetical protein VSX64_04495 [Aurantimonas sp. C2-6-R+9]|uniref:hypothetical protein n=1 Tax=unclassified Aurantimonas TaxID=2638230 RepID=UPI002E184B6D|nr:MULTISPECIES: hypothetical protein [unclassified Aurantimonas]MEC5289219.1 hypothetical protein [Aurantimonas sp. C2-3-R2]MEC5380145.1 hypothetical protein [Aurantimonas sp. C2-6-R+9]MEC5410331.1 hypothetical protein [Aurantimonas sp. C2-4-R8]